MTAANNIHSLLTGKTGAFIDALNPSDAVRDKILGARRDIRGHLRDRFDKLSKDASAQQAWGLLSNSVNVVQPLRLRPLFFTQGAYAYKTWNAPAHSSQEIDLDDGLYLPISAFENAGNPRLASAALFAVVDEMLAELCRVPKPLLRSRQIDRAVARANFDSHPERHKDCPSCKHLLSSPIPSVPA